MEHSRFKAIEKAQPVDGFDLQRGAVRRFSSGSVVAAQSRRSICLDGIWRRKATDLDCSHPEIDDSEWPTVRVPDCYGVEPELSRYFGPIWYRRNLTLPTDLAQCWLDLDFDSADYYCEVYLNGELLGKHEGYFAPFCFDVTGMVRKESLLAVRIECPLEDLDPSEYFLAHRKRQIKGVLNHHDSRPGGMPGVVTPGWTAVLGQSIPTGGITGSVKLRVTGAVRIDALFATPVADLLQVAVVMTNRWSESLSVELAIEVNGVRRHSSVLFVELAPGPNRLDLTADVSDFAHWFPCPDSGNAALHELSVVAVVGNEVSDSQSILFGIRHVALEAYTSDNWCLRINNRPFVVRGAGYIPTQHFAGRGPDWYSRDLDIARELGLNSFWLHAHQQPDAFYNAADRAGVLVFQDFSLQWSYESSEVLNKGFRDRALRMIAEMAYSLWNHPSVVYWNCHNEPPYVWLQDRSVDDLVDLDNNGLDGSLEDRLSSIDPSRPISRASGRSGEHRYEGSLAGGALGDFARSRGGLVSEFGFPTPGWSWLSSGEIEWPPNSRMLKEWASRISCLGTTSTYIGAPERYESPQDWIYAAQRYCAHLVKYQTETMRTWPSSNFFQHMFVDWWGYAGMGLVDVERRPKLAFYWFKDALRPLLALIAYPRTLVLPGESLSLPVWVVSDKEHATNALVVSWRLCRVKATEIITSDPDAAMLGGTGIPAPEGHSVALPRSNVVISELDAGRFYTPVNAHSSVLAGHISFTTPTEAPCGYTVFIKWENPLGVSGENWFHFAVADGQFEPGLWPAPRFDLSVGVADPVARTRVRINSASLPGKDHIEGETGEGGVVLFQNLPPDIYEISLFRQARRTVIELWSDTSIDLC